MLSRTLSRLLPVSRHSLRSSMRNCIVSETAGRSAVGRCYPSHGPVMGLTSSSSLLLPRVAAAAPSLAVAGLSSHTHNLSGRMAIRCYASSSKKSTTSQPAEPKQPVLRAVPGIGKVYVDRLAAKGIKTVNQLADNILEQLSHADACEAWTPAVKYLQGLGIRRGHAQRIVKHITSQYDQDLHNKLQEHEAAAETEAAGGPQLTFCVEGNISAGKSTFLHYITNNNEELMQQLGVVHEPVDKWQSVPTVEGGTLNLLDKFYSDPPRYAYSFQNYVFMSRVMQERNSRDLPRPVRLMERSVFSDRMVFVRAVRDSGWMGDVELAVYDSWFDPILAESPALVPDGFIYLKCHPSTCMERLKMRGRHEEDTVSMDYLEDLHLKHEDWLGAGQAFDKAVRISRPKSRKPMLRSPSGLLLPDISSSRLRDSLFFLDANSSPQEMHTCLNEVPALVLDCDRDVLRDLDLQRQVQATVSEYIKFMRDRKKLLQVEKQAGRLEIRGRPAQATQPGAPEGVQQQATEIVQQAAQETSTRVAVVPNSSGVLQAHVDTQLSAVSGALEVLTAATAGSRNNSQASRSLVSV